MHMSRWSYDPPDTDRYEDKPEDVDVPDFTEPDPPVDPAEHAAHALIDALTTLEQQIVLATTLERLDVLRKLAKRAEQHATLVNGKCAAAIDTLLERRR
jgi:hypothetical protein